jgi:YfiH family protein
LLRAGTLARDRVVHGFTTRLGGVSEGPLATLNLGRPEADPEETRAVNWRRAVAAMDPRLDVADLVLLSQVHGARVIEATSGGGPLACVAEADAAVTTVPGVILAVRVADCVPVLLGSRGGVGVAHAGWRGIAANVVGAAVRALADATGDAPSDMVAGIGPHISAAAYEVGPEVVDALVQAGLDPRIFLRPGSGNRCHVDLGAAVAEQLRRAGIGGVETLGVCSARDSRFFSHRRDGSACGRMAGLVARLP